MNIMFLIYSFNTGGIERLLIDMSSKMLERGNNISLCVINEDYSYALLDKLPQQVKVIKLHRQPGNGSFIKYMKMLSNEVQKNNIQILHCQGVNCVIFSAIAKAINRHTIVVNTVHTCGNYTSYSNAKIFVQNRICSMTIAISHTIEKEILSRKMSSSKVTTVYNAINTNKFQYHPENIRRHHSAFNNDDKIQIGCVARFYPAQKGQDTLIKAVLLLIKNYPHIHCNLAGDIFKGQESAYNELQLLIQKNNASENFSFLGNIEDVPSFLDNQDIFVLPSHTEAFGIALIEAMSSGLPCIASRLEGPEEILEDKSLGLLFAPGNEHDLARNIAYMIEHIGSFDNAKISEYVKVNFDIETMVDKHLEIYQTILN